MLNGIPKCGYMIDFLCSPWFGLWLQVMHQSTPQVPVQYSLRSSNLDSHWVLVTLESLNWPLLTWKNDWAHGDQGPLKHFSDHWLPPHSQGQSSQAWSWGPGLWGHRWLSLTLCLSQVHGSCGNCYSTVSHLFPQAAMLITLVLLCHPHASPKQGCLGLDISGRRLGGTQATQ